RGYGTEADLPCVTARGWPKSELRTSGSVLTCGGEFNSRHIVRRSGPKSLMTQSPQRDPSLEKRPQRRTGPKFPGKGRQRG
ncbi:unnamed protein product, partial [Brassica napus]